MARLFVALLMIQSIAVAQVIITEVMFNPQGSERANEFVEIYNSGTTPADLSGWQIGDGTATDLVIEAGGNGLILQPNQYGLILDPDYFTDSLQIYNPLIPAQALVLTIAGPTIGSNGLSNSRAETVELIDANADTLQRYPYSLDNPEGFSDEKIELTPDNRPGNWGNARFLNGTPGARNSLTRAERDAAISALYMNTTQPIVAQPLQIRAYMFNRGRTVIENFNLVSFLDDNHNGIPDPEEILNSDAQQPLLAPDDSLEITLEFTPSQAGQTRFGLHLELSGDGVPQDNTALLSFFVDDPYRIDLVINEIMARPESGKFEWVELLNNGSNPVDLATVFFADARDTVQLADSGRTLAAGQFLVLARDSAVITGYQVPPGQVAILSGFPTLNNDFDDLKLLGPTGIIYDQVPYRSDWYGREAEAGVSLEKLNPNFEGRFARNWSASVSPSGSTPGQPNSVFLEVLPLQSSLEIQPNPFSPDSDGRDDFTAIRYQLDLETAFVELRIFDLRGRLIRRLANAEPSAQSNQYVWDGKDEQGRIVRIGAYICLLEALNPEKKVLRQLKKTIIVAKK